MNRKEGFHVSAIPTPEENSLHRSGGPRILVRKSLPIGREGEKCSSTARVRSEYGTKTSKNQRIESHDCRFERPVGTLVTLTGTQPAGGVTRVGYPAGVRILMNAGFRIGYVEKEKGGVVERLPRGEYEMTVGASKGGV